MPIRVNPKFTRPVQRGAGWADISGGRNFFRIVVIGVTTPAKAGGGGYALP